MRRNMLVAAAALLSAGILLAGCGRGEDITDRSSVAPESNETPTEDGHGFMQSTAKEDKEKEDNAALDENMTLFDDFKEMDYVLFLETNVGYELTGDYFKYGVYGDFTKTVEDGEALYFRLNEKILNEEELLSGNLSKPLTHWEWIDYAGEHIVYMTPNLEWVISRQFTDPKFDQGGCREKWRHDQNIVNEINSNIVTNILTFIPQKGVSNGYEAMNVTQVQEVNKLLKDIYGFHGGFGIGDIRMICFDETGKMLAAGECRQEGVSIYSITAEKCIRIYDISKEKIELLYEFPIPKSEIAWPVEISQFVGDKEEGWLVFSVGDSTYKMNYPDGEACKIGEFMFCTSYSPDGKYVAYCTGNIDLFDSWEDMVAEEEYTLDLDLYHNIRERWDAIAPGWYVEELETGNKTYIPIELDCERPIYGGQCMWIERDELLQLLK